MVNYWDWGRRCPLRDGHETAFLGERENFVIRVVPAEENPDARKHVGIFLQEGGVGAELLEAVDALSLVQTHEVLFGVSHRRPSYA